MDQTWAAGKCCHRLGFIVITAILPEFFPQRDLIKSKHYNNDDRYKNCTFDCTVRFVRRKGHIKLLGCQYYEVKFWKQNWTVSKENQKYILSSGKQFFNVHCSQFFEIYYLLFLLYIFSVLYFYRLPFFFVSWHSSTSRHQ